MTGGAVTRRRPFRDPHHSASLPALVGGGLRARPGEISLAHNGVLFLDELPEFNRQTLESLRQPMETARAVIARANAHVTYPARFQLVAAMNPCRCGHLDDPSLACSRAPRCGREYQSKISGPLFDRIDLHVEVPAVSAADLSLPPPAEGSAAVAARVATARAIQAQRYETLAPDRRILHQRRGRRRAAGGSRRARRRRPQAADRGGRAAQAVGARVSPGAARRADAGGPGRGADACGACISRKR